MKKILYSFVLFAFVFPTIASAATFSFSPATGSFAPGDVFSVLISVNSNANEEITVAKLVAQFPANVLEATSFALADGWITPTSGEFDSLDNTAGTFEKMAGFPARITTQKPFGTVTFKAKMAGTATINASDGSIILDITNSNKYIVSSGATFAIVTPAPKPTIKTTEKVTEKKVPTVKNTQIEEGSKLDSGSEIITSTSSETNNIATSSLATVGEVGNKFFTTKNIIFSVGFILFVILGFFSMRKKRYI